MKKIPKYKALRITIISGLFYFFLIFPFLGFILIQKIPEYIDLGIISNGNFSTNNNTISINLSDSTENNPPKDLDSIIQNAITQNQPLIQEEPTSNSGISPEIAGIPNSKNPTVVNEFVKGFNAGNKAQKQKLKTEEDDRPGYLANSLDIFFTGLLIILAINFIISIPYRRFFKRTRSGKKISSRLEFFCRRYVLYTPAIYSGLFAILVLITVGYIGYVNLYVDLDNTLNAGIFDDYFFVAAVAGFLTTLFVYYWHKHRVHIFYIEVLFKEEELRKSIFNKGIGRIRNRLWLASGMTTLLPLIIVIFYIILSITKVSGNDVDLESTGIREIILGDYSQLFKDQEIEDFIYINSVNAFMMIVGIGTSIFISLIYILTFVRWTTLDIVFPVKELLGNMQKTGEGKNTHFSIVRTNDEIGELAEGFNVMSYRIKNYIDSISEINNSYYRFVPKQFLDFLDKKSITDIHLGDQIQKEMTIMFSDIRSFTQISEQLTPRENFNFINHYLGYMEPIISRNHGFIDKYIGDAIMALFPDSPDDAINAAIEMRNRLLEFNEDLKSQGNLPIDIGIGINTGNLMLGIVGGKGRIEGTVISDHVNLTSRLEGLTKKYGTPIIISQETLIKLNAPQSYQYRFLDMVMVKGKRNSVNIFEILDGENPINKKQKLITNELYKKGLQLYRSKEFESALETFKQIADKSSNDKVIDIYMKRCEDFIKNGVPEEWDGIAKMDEK